MLYRRGIHSCHPPTRIFLSDTLSTMQSLSILVTLLAVELLAGKEKKEGRGNTYVRYTCVRFPTSKVFPATKANYETTSVVMFLLMNEKKSSTLDLNYSSRVFVFVSWYVGLAAADQRHKSHELLCHPAESAYTPHTSTHHASSRAFFLRRRLLADA